MEALRVYGTKEFMGGVIPVVCGGFGRDKKCITDKAIGDIHGQETREIRRRVTANKKRFQEYCDYIDLKKAIQDFQVLVQILSMIGYTQQMIRQSRQIFIFSERGYAKLIKLMDTDKAWDIHDKLMDDYFRARDNTDSYISREEFIQFQEEMRALLTTKNTRTLYWDEENLLMEPPAIITEDTELVPTAKVFRKEVEEICKSVMDKNHNFNSMRSVLFHCYRILTWGDPFVKGVNWTKERWCFEKQSGTIVQSVFGMLANMHQDDPLRKRFLDSLKELQRITLTNTI
ncbi:MAG: hypothetical protein PEPC_01695 [Peptostreptococcus russellii]